MALNTLGDFVEHFDLKDGMEVDLYRNGLAITEPDQATTILWQEIKSIRSCGRKHNTCLELNLFDERQHTLRTKKKTDSIVVQIVMHRVTTAQLPVFFDQLLRGETLDFGPIKMSKKGLQIMGDTFEWADDLYLGYTLAIKNIELFRNGKRRDVYSMPPRKVINVSALLQMVHLILQTQLWKYDWDPGNLPAPPSTTGKKPIPTPDQACKATSQYPKTRDLIPSSILISAMLFPLVMAAISLLVGEFLYALFYGVFSAISLLALQTIIHKFLDTLKRGKYEIMNLAVIHEDRMKLTSIDGSTSIVYWKDIKTLQGTFVLERIEDVSGKNYYVNYVADNPKNSGFTEIVQENVSKVLFKDAIEKLNRGESIQFENLSVNAEGVQVPEKFLPYDLLRWYPGLLDHIVNVDIERMPNFMLFHKLFEHLALEPARFKLTPEQETIH